MARRTRTMKPFADDTASVEIGGLSIENGSERVAVHGSVDLTRDKVGLNKAKALKQHVDAVVAVLEGDKDLPAEAVETKMEATTVKNPFG